MFVLEIDKLEISDKKWDFMHSIITIIITTVAPPHGKGVSEAKKDFKQYFGTNQRQIIPVENDNNLCLFYAVELSRLYHDNEIIYDLKKRKRQISNHLLTHKSFNRLLKNSERKRQMVYELLNKNHIDGKNESYGLDHLHIIQEYYDICYPGLIFNKNMFINTKMQMY